METVVEFIFSNGSQYYVVKRSFLEIMSMIDLAKYAYRSHFMAEYLERGFFLKTINLL